MNAAVAQHAGRRVHVGQGEHHVTGDPDVMLSTILGSCISVCLRDARIGVGGMNHFLLPESSGNEGDPVAPTRYGAHAMEVLINDILRLGGHREDMTAKVFGGAKMFNDLHDIGGNNAAFAERFLADEGITVVGRSTGGRGARRIHYWPATGRVLVRIVDDIDAVASAERRTARQQPPGADGAVELF